MAAVNPVAHKEHLQLMFGREITDYKQEVALTYCIYVLLYLVYFFVYSKPMTKQLFKSQNCDILT